MPDYGGVVTAAPTPDIAPVTGALSSNASLALALSGQATAVFQLIPTALVGVVNFECSSDSGTTWVPLAVSATGLPAGAGLGTSVVNLPAATVYQASVSGLTNIRARVSGYVSGSVAVTLRGSASTSSVSIDSVTPVSTEGVKPTYSVTITALAAVSGDMFVLTGSATKVARLTKVEFSGAATAATDVDIQIIKRNVADTAGTSTAPVITPYDSSDGAATCVANAYTVAPTVNDGTVRVLSARKVTVPSITTPAVSPPAQIWEFGTRNERCPVLRGIAQQIALSVVAAPAGATFDITFTFTEE